MSVKTARYLCVSCPDGCFAGNQVYGSAMKVTLRSGHFPLGGVWLKWNKYVWWFYRVINNTEPRNPNARTYKHHTLEPLTAEEIQDLMSNPRVRARVNGCQS